MSTRTTSTSDTSARPTRRSSRSKPCAGQIAESDGDVAERVTVVSPGEQVDVGLPVTAVGEMHAVIHDDLPRVFNSGYVVDAGGARLYHPGDSFTPPGGPVDVLCLPIHAPWSKIAEVIDFARSVGAGRALAVHDGLLNETGLSVVGRNLGILLNDGSYDGWSPAPTSPPSDRTDEPDPSVRIVGMMRSVYRRTAPPGPTLDRTRLPRGRWRRVSARPRG